MDESMFDVHEALEDKHWWFVARRRILFSIIEKIMIDTPRKLLVDVGCGTGGTLLGLEQKYGYLGIDVSERAIATAKLKRPDGKFRCGRMPEDLQDISSKAGLFMLMDVLEHVKDDFKFLSDVVSLAKTGTNILITVPANKVLWSNHDETAGHVRRYEQEQLTALWKDLPVHVRLVSFYNSHLYPLIWSVRQLTRHMSLTFGQGKSDFSLPPAWINKLLIEIFASERRRIEFGLDNNSAKAYQHGVSLLAVLRRD